MTEVICHTIRKARKDYYDDGWEYIEPFLSDRGWTGIKGLKITFAHARILVWAKNNRREAKIILKGQTYIHQVNKIDGCVYTFRIKKIFHDMCVKYKLYMND